MATGDTADMLVRLRGVLPQRWLADETPVLDAVLAGLASAWSGLYLLLQLVSAQSRIATASDQFLDMVSTDFFGVALPRRPGEEDVGFRTRIDRELFRERGTRAAITTMLTDLTGRAPLIFEPTRAMDTGAWSTASMGYGVAGAWGSLSLPYQCFVTAYRPIGTGIANAGGYSTAGVHEYADLDWIVVPVTDANIYAAVASVMPAATIAWTRISS